VGEISILDLVQTVAVAWVVFVQIQLRSKLIGMEETVEDAGWNWERDDMYPRGCAIDKVGWEPANSRPSDQASG
jgi:hypothetical protein